MIHAARPDPVNSGSARRRSKPSRGLDPGGRGTASSWRSSGRTAPGSRPACGCSRRCLPPTSGTAVVAGHDVVAEPRRGPRSGSATSGRATAPADDQRVRDELVPRAAATGWSRGGRARPAPTSCIESLELGAARQAHGVHAVRRPAAAARRRLGLVHAPAAAVPRRAVDRAGPAEPGEPVGHSSGSARSTARRSS